MIIYFSGLRTLTISPSIKSKHVGSPLKLNEELASQDIPMVLNSTPGVYATQTGGGDGDADGDDLRII